MNQRDLTLPFMYDKNFVDKFHDNEFFMFGFERDEILITAKNDKTLFDNLVKLKK